jgi:two-component system cell cycle sensor histidine kinase/response regulator CckA
VFTDPKQAMVDFGSKADEYALVVTDYNMPQLSGLEVASVIRSFRQDIPILMVTGYAEELSDRMLAEAGVTRVLRKPMTMEEFAMAIDELVHPKAE